MYDNIGNKIKSLAKTIFIVEAICTVIAGIALLATDDDFILIGLLTLFCGPIVAWVSSWILYAFGELVEDVHAIRVINCPNKEQQKLKSPVAQNIVTSKQGPVPSICNKCELCGKESQNLHRCKINDTVGWADLCDECAKKH